MTFRPATLMDVPALRRLYDEFHLFHVRGVPDRLLVPAEPQDDGRFRDSIATILGDEHAMLLVAETDGQLVGFAEIYLRDEDASPYRPGRRYAHLQSLAVTEASRRGGIGVRLLHRAEEWAFDQGASEIRTDVWEFDDGPLPFYERDGYSTLRRTLVKRRSN